MTLAWREYALLMRLHKPIGIYLLLWPTLWALWIGGAGRPDWWVVLIFILGVVLMRSAGCVINDFADRHVDPHIERTKTRPLASGAVSSREALILFAVLCLSAFLLVLMLNRLTILLSFVAIALASIYPFSKRYTYLPQVVLGAAFGWSIPMAFAALTNDVPILAWWLFFAKLTWTVAYDTMYAMVDRDDDIKIGVKSTAILFARWDKVIVGALQVITLAFLVWVGVLAELGWIYFVTLAGSSGFFIYQQWLIKDRQRARCFQAFLNNHWFGKVVFLGILADYLWPMIQAW
jgi:4-hydroxybenzoate polyprenyltransferase